MLFFNFLGETKKIHAEVITASGISLLYYLLGASAAGVTFYSLKDVKLSFKHYEKGLTTAQKLEFARVAKDKISDVLSGYKPKFDTSNLLDYLKNTFSPDKSTLDIYDNEEYGDIIFDDDFRVSPYFSYADFYSGKVISIYTNGQLLQIRAPLNYYGVEFYFNGKFVYKVKYQPYLTWRFWGSRYYSVCTNDGSPIEGTTQTVEPDAPSYPLNGVSVKYGTSYRSYVGSNDEPVDIGLPGLPYVPGRTIEDKETGSVVFPGSMEDLLDILENDSTFLDTLLERLLGKDNHDLVGYPALNPVHTDDGIVFPNLENVPSIDIPDVVNPDTPFTDVPVVEVPGDIGGLWGWLYQLLVAIYNMLRNISNSIRSLISNLLQGLLNMLKSLFIPRDGIISDHVYVMESSIKNKIGSNLYTSLFDKLKSLNGEPIPDLYIGTSKVLDASYVNSFAEVVKSWQRWFYYVLIALYNMNSIYKLIRNGEMIERSGGAKK